MALITPKSTFSGLDIKLYRSTSCRKWFGVEKSCFMALHWLTTGTICWFADFKSTFLLCYPNVIGKVNDNNQRIKSYCENKQRDRENSPRWWNQMGPTETPVMLFLVQFPGSFLLRQNPSRLSFTRAPMKNTTPTLMSPGDYTSGRRYVQRKDTNTHL